jgi:hypothetical protein
MQYGYAIVKDKNMFSKFEKTLVSSIDYMSHNVITVESVKSGYTNPNNEA